MSNYISVNIIQKALKLLKTIHDNECNTISDIYYLRLPYGYNLQSSLDFAIQCKWLLIENSQVSCSEEGLSIINSFDGNSITPQLWRQILYIYISVCTPAWSKRIPYGRKEAFLFMNEEEQRCFSEAGLINSQEDEVIEWWDKLAGIERAQKNASFNEVGRKGEKLTLEYEERRTGIIPTWKSIETNTSGYDVLSHRSSENNEQILIEVKTSTQAITDSKAIVTRHEWEVANYANNLNRYFFHFWDLSNRQKKLAILSVDEISNHIPMDCESGKWETASVPFSVFRERFVDLTQ